MKWLLLGDDEIVWFASSAGAWATYRWYDREPDGRRGE
jgi:hypothetical protein